MKDDNHTNPEPPLTRDQMQVEAHTIETLLKAAMAMLGSTDSSEVFSLLEMAQERTKMLNDALDDLHVSEEAA